MIRTGIIGGTFDPIHNAHIKLARCAYEQLGLCKVIFMPAYIPPHKRNNNITDEHYRMEMTRLAVKDFPWAEVSDMEIKLQGASYTARTLTVLDEAADTELVFILGADSYLALDTWYHPEIIFAHAAVACARRDGVTLNQLETKGQLYIQKYNGKSYFLDMDDTPVSSHEIRRLLQNGEDVSQYIPSEVYEYIKSNNLY